MFAIRPFLEGFTRLPSPPTPGWHFDARSAGNRAFVKAANEGKSGEDCSAAYDAAWAAVEAAQ